MELEDELKTAKTGVTIIGDIIKAAGDSPDVREAGNNLGKTALTITKAINNVLLPLAAVNYSFDKAKIYFSNKFAEDISKKTAEIPTEDLVEPKASIAGPALQGLAFTHEEENLKDMYISLLATAMNSKTSEDAHPAFVEIIKQLTSEEATLLESVLKSSKPLPICEVRIQENGKREWETLSKHLINILHSETHLPVEDNRFPSMVENWIRLGLVEVNYTTHLANEDAYKWNETRPEVEKFRIKYENETSKIVLQNGMMQKTALGARFAKAVDI